MYADPSGYQSNKNQGNLNPCEITKSAAENSKSGKNSELIDIYNSIKESPNYPSNFETVKNETKKILLKIKSSFFHHICIIC